MVTASKTTMRDLAYEDPVALSHSDEPLSTRYGIALFDLDGVVYLQGEPIAGIPETFTRLREVGAAPEFITNNASRRPAEVATLLRDRGIAADTDEIRTSAQAAAEILRQRLSPGEPILVVGSSALFEEVSAAGMRAVRTAADGDVTAIVQGYGPKVGWKELATATTQVRRGAMWIATNTDTTMPSKDGPLPGNGTMVTVVATAVGRRPDMVAGKPSPEILWQAARSRPRATPLMIGDRWDTDIEGARNANMDSLLVLSGSTTPAEVLEIPPRSRPSYLAWTAAGIHHPQPRVEWDAAAYTAQCRGWMAEARDGDLRLTGHGESLDALRALAQAAWASAASPNVTAGDDGAAHACDALGIAG